MRSAGHLQRIQDEQYHIVIHQFTEDFPYQDPEFFTDPFRYIPHPSVTEAARLVMKRIEQDSTYVREFEQGKMIGVLVSRTSEGKLCYTAAFSGNVGGRSTIEGFVPPIFDLVDPDGEFKKREAEISAINEQISILTDSVEFALLKKELNEAVSVRDSEIEEMRTRMAVSKKKREELRLTCKDTTVIESLIRESQFEKAELKRLKASWEERISVIRSRLDAFTRDMETLKQMRASMSENLQDWIFRQYLVHNAEGECISIADLFARQGLTPPGGTGECAAPKLLEHAYLNGLKPLAMGEFWYGQSPRTAVRTHGHFYPSCTSKCGPLLGHMMKGLSFQENDVQTDIMPVIIYEDDVIIATEKPGGMPSVPGLNGRQSLTEWLENIKGNVFPVHRLDMDTSGIMLFAKTETAAVNLRRQFEEHSIRKTYMARLCASDHTTEDHGVIHLPLSPDYDERPRQKIDHQHGKEAQTGYEVAGHNPDGTTDILLFPHTGRTHQLRVHCAHTLGLGRPILGDRLYGSCSVHCSMDTRLHLHAFSITFSHPLTEKEMTFSSDQLCF